MTSEERFAHAERAWMDAAADPDPNANCVTAAVRSAITVKLTPGVFSAAFGHFPGRNSRERLIDIFRAAGFIVEE